MSISYPPTGLREINYLFVDAGCLREAVKGISKRYLGNEDDASIDWGALRPGYDKAFIYDAVFAQQHGESQGAYEQRIAHRMAELREMRTKDGVHVQLGDLRGKKVVQKKVDVMIAVDMLLHTFRRNMHRCTLLTGDSDFQPLLEALTREGMFTTLWHPAHAPDDLKGAADSLRPLIGSELPLKRPDGAPLQARDRRSAIRPNLNGGVELFKWTDDDRELLLSFSGLFRLERYDPLASAMSDQIVDPVASIVFANAEDDWNIAIPEAARVEAQKHGVTTVPNA